MHAQTEKEREVAANYDFFASRVNDLMAEHEGRFALLRHQEIVGYYPDFNAAVDAGEARFADQAFSVQEVRTAPYYISAL